MKRPVRSIHTRRDRAPHSPLTTDDLVDRFAAALKAKLSAAEEKYGFTDAWARPDWRDDLVKHLTEHVAKGDPRDVAAYCAFAWHHGWSVASDDQAGLRDALGGLEQLFARPGENSVERFERIATQFYRDTGLLAPGKDAPAAGGQPDIEERRERYDAWIDAKLSVARGALGHGPSGATPSE